MMIPPETPKQGEWQTDENGRRFRMVGIGAKEYEPTIVIDGIEIPQSQLDAFHANRRAAEQERIKAEAEREKKKPRRRRCPFADGLQTDCRRDACALYVDGCILAQFAGRLPAKDTKGLDCPLNRHGYACRADCALYENGCKITAVLPKERTNEYE